MGAGVPINQPLGSYWHLLGGAGSFSFFLGVQFPFSMDISCQPRLHCFFFQSCGKVQGALFVRCFVFWRGNDLNMACKNSGTGRRLSLFLLSHGPLKKGDIR